MGFSRQKYWSGLSFPSPVDHILSDLSTMTRPSWVAPRGWLTFIELDKAVVLVWLDWLVFCEYGFSVFALWCPLIPSCNTYHLTWISIFLDVGYLLTAAPAKRSHCSLPWTRGISSPPPFLIMIFDGCQMSILCFHYSFKSCWYSTMRNNFISTYM